MTGGEIHGEHPFVPPPEERDPIRRFRGRLVAPVTVITSGRGAARTGLTVSSILVAEGEPARVYFLLSSTTDLHDAVEATGKFVVHILGESNRELGDRFAGLRPSPGGLFADLDVFDGDWGPEIAPVVNRVFCTYVRSEETTHHVLATGTIDRVELEEVTQPLAYYRGRYRLLENP